MKLDNVVHVEIIKYFVHLTHGSNPITWPLKTAAETRKNPSYICYLNLPRTKYPYFFPIFLLIYKIITIFIPCKTINCMYKYNYKNFEGPFPRWQMQKIYRKANGGNVSHQCMSLKSTSLLSFWSLKSSSDSWCTELVLIFAFAAVSESLNTIRVLCPPCSGSSPNQLVTNVQYRCINYKKIFN